MHDPLGIRKTCEIGSTILDFRRSGAMACAEVIHTFIHVKLKVYKDGVPGSTADCDYVHYDMWYYFFLLATLKNDSNLRLDDDLVMAFL